MRLKDVLKGVACRAGRADLGTEVTGVSDDSRAVKEGDIFVAVRGCALDGHEFIGEALSKGAGAVVSEDDFSEPSGRVAKILTADTRKALPVIADNFYSHPSKAMKVIGITGTNGKTTISYIIEAIVRSSGHEPGVIGTINYRYRGSYIPSKNTTPGVLDLQSMLARMLRDGVDHAIMEVSSHSLDQGRIERVSLDAGIFTNITSDHLDYHKTRQRYFRAKIRLFDHLKTGVFAILNTDNSKVASLKR